MRLYHDFIIPLTKAREAPNPQPNPTPTPTPARGPRVTRRAVPAVQ